MINWLHKFPKSWRNFSSQKNRKRRSFHEAELSHQKGLLMTFKNSSCACVCWRANVCNQETSFMTVVEIYAKHKQTVASRNTSTSEFIVCLITTSTLSTTWLLSELSLAAQFRCFTFNSPCFCFVYCEQTSLHNDSQWLRSRSRSSRDRFSLSCDVRGRSCVFTIPRHSIFRFKWHFSIFTRESRFDKYFWILINADRGQE